MARDQVIEEPTVVHPLLRHRRREPEPHASMQGAVMAGFGVDVLVNHGTRGQGALRRRDHARRRFPPPGWSANPNADRARRAAFTLHVADALAVMGGNLDAADGYRGSMTEDAQGVARLRRAGRGGGRRRAGLTTSRRIAVCRYCLYRMRSDRLAGAGRGFLLRHAVQRAEAPHQIDGVDADHLPGRETARPACSSARAVVRIVERRHQHRLVGDVEVRVARRQAHAVEEHAAPASAAARTRSGRPSAVGHASRGARGSRAAARSSRRRGRLLRDARPCARRRSGPDRRRGRACRRRRCRGRATAPCARRGRRRARARAPRAPRPGLRACTVCSRHSSVVSSVPAPLTSMLPPSSTTRATRLPIARGRLPLARRRVARGRCDR